MRTVLLTIVFLILMSETSASDAPDRNTILDTIDQFFLALGSADADAMEGLLAPHAIDVIITPDQEDKVQARQSSGTIERMRSGSFPKIREWYWSPTVLQRGRLATVWAPYKVDVNDGERGHCGIDVFMMSKPDDRWLIDSIHFTVEPDACDEIKPTDDDILRPDFSDIDAAVE